MKPGITCAHIAEPVEPMKFSSILRFHHNSAILRLPSLTRSVSALLACLALAGGQAIAHDPHDPYIAIAVSPNFAVDQTVLAASGALIIKPNVQVVLKSTDGGVNWSVVPGLGNNALITALAFSPGYALDQTMFVATDSGLFASTNQGTVWIDLYNQAVQAIALSPNFAVDNTLFVVTGTSTILESTNRGATWTAVSVPSALTAGMNSIAVSPNFDVDQTVLLGTIANGIFLSKNAGASWTSVTPGLILPTVSALAFSPGFSTDRTAIAGTYGQGVLVSSNGGSSWASASTGLADLNVTSLALSPTFTADSTIWATTAVGGVFQSTTRAASWNPPSTVSRVLSCLTLTHYQAIAAAAGSSGTVLFMAMYEGVWSSSNLGAAWQYIDTWPTRIVRHINLSPNYAVDGTVFASSYGGGNLWSTNAGLSWTFQNTGMQLAYTDASAISPNYANDGTAFSGNFQGLQRTTNSGATWEMMVGIGAGIQAYPRSMAVSPNFAVDQTVFIGLLPASPTYCPDQPPGDTPGLYISSDGGNTWTLSSLNGVGVASISISPNFATDLTAYAASPTPGASVYVTTNAGVTWSALTFPGTQEPMAVVAVSPNFANDHTVMAGGLLGGIYRSTNRGSTWTEIFQTGNIRAMDIQFSPNFANDQTVFAGTVQEGVMISTNGGRTLTSLTAFPDTFVMAVGVSPNFAVDNTVFAAGYHGLYQSVNRGAAWSYLAAPSRIEETRNITSPLNEPPTIGYDGLWSFITASLTASTYGYATTPESQDTATISFVGSGIGWLSITGQDQGTASIQLDGVPEGTISLYAPGPDQFQQSVWEQHGIACGAHTFTITALPQTLQSIALDAFEIWIDTCPVTISGNPAALSSTSATVGSEAGSGSVTLTTPGAWTAYANAPWLQLASGSTAGSGNATIAYTYLANPNAGSQVGTLTIAGLTFLVTQAGSSYLPTASVNALLTSGLNDPRDVAVDSQGNVYIADTGDDAIKQLAPGATAPVTIVGAGLNGPSGVAVDKLGNVYIADSGNNVVKEWNAANPLAVNVVVTGLNNPAGVAVDALGNIYVANTGADTIQEWNVTTQTTTTLVSGLNSPLGIALDSLGNVYFSDYGNNAIKEWNVSTQAVTILVSGLSGPTGVAVDGQGNVYFADTGSGTIREWSPVSQLVTVLVSSGLSNPAGLALDRQGDIYIADSGDNAVREATLAYVALSAASLTEAAAAGTDSVTAQILPAGTPLTAVSSQPWLTIAGITGGVINFSFLSNTTGASRTAIITVLSLQVTVTQISDTPAILTACAGAAQTTELGQPFATALQVCLTDAGGNPIVGWPITFTVTPGSTGAGGTFGAAPPMPIPTSAAGTATAPALTANGVAGTFTVSVTVGALSATFTLTNAAYTLGASSVLVGSAAGSGSVLLVASGAWTANSNASWLQLYAGSSSGTGNALIEFTYAANPNASAQTGTLTISGLTFTVTQAGASFTPIGQVSVLVSSGLSGPQAVAVDGSGNVYIADSSNNVIKEWNASTGQVSVLVPFGLNDPGGVAVDAQGNVYIADTKNNAIKKWNVATGMVTPVVLSGLSSPHGVAVDGQGNVYFADTGHNAIKEWLAATKGILTLVSAGLNSPQGVAVDALGNVYFADSKNNQIKQWSPVTMLVSTLVPSGLNSPHGVAVDGDGNVYIADTGNNAIKECNPVSGQVTALVSTGLKGPDGVAVDGQGNVYIADTGDNAIKKYTAIYLSLGTPGTLGASAGTGSIAYQVLPASTLLTATSKQSWLTITGAGGGTISFSFSANTSINSRTAQIVVLGQVLTVTQSGDTPASIVRVAGYNQTATAGHPFSIALEVRVLDAAGNGIQGAGVTFTAVPGPTGSSGTFASFPPMPIVTGPGGSATAPTLTANTVAGPFTVTAAVGSLTTVFALTIVNP